MQTSTSSSGSWKCTTRSGVLFFMVLAHYICMGFKVAIPESIVKLSEIYDDDVSRAATCCPHSPCIYVCTCVCNANYVCNNSICNPAREETEKGENEKNIWEEKSNN